MRQSPQMNQRREKRKFPPGGAHKETIREEAWMTKGKVMNFDAQPRLLHSRVRRAILLGLVSAGVHPSPFHISATCRGVWKMV